MAAIGLVILAVAGIVALAGGLDNSGSDHVVNNFSILGLDVNATSGRLFLYGAVLGGVAMLGLNMFLAGVGRGFKNKVKTRRQLKAEHARQGELEDERNKLERELQAERGANNARPLDITDDTTAVESERHRTR